MPQPDSGHEDIVGRYVNITSNSVDYRIFYEEAGAGVPEPVVPSHDPSAAGAARSVESAFVQAGAAAFTGS